MRRLDQVLSSLRLLLEVILFVDILNDLLVLALDVLDLLLEVFELEVKGLDLLVAADVSRVADGLSDGGVG